jgi:hypothetical protein
MAAPKGHPRYGGRTKGKPNKVTTAVKEALCLAFEGIGGTAKLIEWGKKEKNRAEFYKLWVKILPKEIEVSGNPDHPLEMNVNVIASRIEQLRSAFRGVARRSGGGGVSSNGTGKHVHPAGD